MRAGRTCQRQKNLVTAPGPGHQRSYLFLRYRLLRKESAGSLYDHGHRGAGA